MCSGHRLFGPLVLCLCRDGWYSRLDIFAIAIQRAAARVNQDVPGQISRFIVDDFASADPADLVKQATDHFSRLAAELGSANHKAKCKIVVARASQETSC